MKAALLGLILVLAPASGALGAAEIGATILLVARDTQNHRIPGVRFFYQEVKTGLTSREGKTALNLPAGEDPGK